MAWVADSLENRKRGFRALDRACVVAHLCVCDTQVAQCAPFSGAIPDFPGYDNGPVEALDGAREVTQCSARDRNISIQIALPAKIARFECNGERLTKVIQGASSFAQMQMRHSQVHERRTFVAPVEIAGGRKPLLKEFNCLQGLPSVHTGSAEVCKGVAFGTSVASARRSRQSERLLVQLDSPIVLPDACISDAKVAQVHGLRVTITCLLGCCQRSLSPFEQLARRQPQGKALRAVKPVRAAKLRGQLILPGVCCRPLLPSFDVGPLQIELRQRPPGLVAALQIKAISTVEPSLVVAGVTPLGFVEARHSRLG